MALSLAATSSSSTTNLSYVSFRFKNPKVCPPVALLSLASPSYDSPRGSLRISVDAAPKVRFITRRKESVSVRQLQRPLSGIPPLVELLEFVDPKVQRAAAGALRTLAFENDENKHQVGVIGNLVHSSPNIKKEVLAAGALQPIVALLRCIQEEGYDDIRGEIEMLQQCNHPNVIRYFESYQGDEYLWIVMEYCGCGSVAGLMNVTEAPLEEHQIAYICKEALKGLFYLHSIFKAHRDIKGGNILLTSQGEVKLGDFGVAAQLTRTMSRRNTVTEMTVSVMDGEPVHELCRRQLHNCTA